LAAPQCGPACVSSTVTAQSSCRVAREFASAIHGEVDPDLAQWFLQHQAGENGLLERIGIDGIIVAREFNFTPQRRQPNGNWQPRPMKAAFFIAVASRSQRFVP